MILPPATVRTAVLAALLAVSAPCSPWAAAADPRAELVELQRQNRLELALERALALAEEDPERAGRWGLDLLIGDLHHRLGRPQGAMAAFALAMGRAPEELALYGRYLLAREQAETGHPETAAGLVASVVAARPEAPPTVRAVRLLRETVEDGGDCRLLGRLDASRYGTAARRQLELVQAVCALRDGDPGAARGIYLGLLREELADEPALTAARQLDLLAGGGGGAPPPDDETLRLLGLAFYQHRDFDRAVAHLGRLVGGFDGPLAGDRWDLAYTVVRSRFWQERYAQAAGGYAALAARSRDAPLAARALYQQGRSHELMGDWPDAIAAFRLAYRTDPDGRSADGALIGALRLEWRSGSEATALELYELLTARRAWTGVAARASLFLASSDLVQGRSDRAGRWLDDAARAGRAAEPELSYWRGRLAELRGDPEQAARRYLRVMELGPYHPLGQDAARRVRRPELLDEAEALARRRLATGTLEGRYEAWLLLSGDPAERARVAHGLARALAQDPVVAPYLTLSLVPTPAWPLWEADLDDGEEKMVALGLWIGGQEALPRHFPMGDPSLAFTRSWMLSRAGALRESLEVAEVLARRAPDRLPSPFLPAGLQRLLYPFAFPDLVVREALARQVDPHLLTAIAREESRFDREALSPASARGLTQFIQPTAERVARQIGLGPLAPEDLYRPEVAFALAAAYVAELLEELGGAPYAAVAAYNAGPPASRLWQSYCYSGELAEYYTKVSYRETRNYLGKVLSSWAHYREIYGAPTPPARPPAEEQLAGDD